MIQQDILVQLYRFGVQHKLVPVLTRTGYDPLSFLRIANEAQLTETLKFGALVGTVDWILVNLIISFFVLGFLGFSRAVMYRPGFVDAVIKAPIREEIIFRFAGITALLYFTGSIFWAIAITSVCFGLIHLYQGITPALITIIGGVILAFAFLTGGLFASIVAHATYNLFVVSLRF